MLLRYVSKSKLKKWIDAFDAAEKLGTGESTDELIQEARHELPQTQLLKTAILAGNATHEIFSHNKCDVWLTYLYHSEQITLEEFLQTYFILLAKNAFDTTQLIYPHETSDHPCIKAYLARLSDRTHISIDGLRNDTLSLSNINQTWIMIPQLAAYQIDPLLKELASIQDDATLISAVNDGRDFFLVVPPIQFVNRILSRMNPEHKITAEPIFGKISTLTLYKDFDLEHKRPINIHSTMVKSNQTAVHGLASTPFSIAAHDFYFHYSKEALIPSQQLSSMLAILDISVRIKKELAMNHPLIKKALDRLIDLNPPFAIDRSHKAANRWLLHISPLQTGMRNNISAKEILEKVPNYYYQFVFALGYILANSRLENPSELANTLIFSEQIKNNKFINNNVNINDLLLTIQNIKTLDGRKNIIIAISLLQSKQSLATKDTLNLLAKDPQKAIEIATTLLSESSQNKLASGSIFHPASNIDDATSSSAPTQKKT